MAASTSASSEARMAPVRRLFRPFTVINRAELERAKRAQQLSELILDRTPDSERSIARREFVRLQFQNRVEWFGARGRLLSALHGFIALVVIAAGLLASGVTAISAPSPLSSWNYLTIALGVVVGVLTGITQIFLPSRRAAIYRRTESDLYREGWNLVFGRGRYVHCQDPEQAWSRFVDVILDTEGRAGLAEFSSEGLSAD
jgi:hypothetical protein